MTVRTSVTPEAVNTPEVLLRRAAQRLLGADFVDDKYGGQKWHEFQSWGAVQPSSLCLAKCLGVQECGVLCTK